MRQNVGLAFSGRGTMTAHRGENERHALARLPEIHHRPDNDVNVADTAASHANRDRGAGSQPRPKTSRAQFTKYFTRDIGQFPVRKLLAHQNHAREVHVMDYINAGMNGNWFRRSTAFATVRRAAVNTPPTRRSENRSSRHPSAATVSSAGSKYRSSPRNDGSVRE